MRKYDLIQGSHVSTSNLGSYNNSDYVIDGHIMMGVTYICKSETDKYPLDLTTMYTIKKGVSTRWWLSRPTNKITAIQVLVNGILVSTPQDQPNGQGTPTTGFMNLYYGIWNPYFDMTWGTAAPAISFVLQLTLEGVVHTVKMEAIS